MAKSFKVTGGLLLNKSVNPLNDYTLRERLITERIETLVSLVKTELR